MGKFIISFTPTGLIPTKQMTPHIPVATDEIVKEVLNARKFGISIVHLYARNSEGKPTQDSKIYKEIIEGIRAVDGYNSDALILCIPACEPDGSSIEQYTTCIELVGTFKPDMARLPVGSNYPDKLSANNNAKIIEKNAQKIKDYGIKPVIEIFGEEAIDTVITLQEKEIIEPPFYFDTVFNNGYGNTKTELSDANLLISQFPENSYWTFGGKGTAQLTMNAMAILQGGGIRIGLGDNIYFDEEEQHLASNENLLDRINQIATLLDSAPYTPAEVREMLGLEIK